MMPDDVRKMLGTVADLARKAGASMDEIAGAAGMQYEHLLDLQRQTAELHADIAELWIRIRGIESVLPRRRDENRGGNNT